MMTLELFLEKAWKRYIKLTPDAEKVLSLLQSKGEKVVNDHIAFRTFNIPGIGRKDFEKIFLTWGYKAIEDLDFPEKKLIATYYVHPQPGLPKIFISELLTEKFSSDIQDWLRDLSQPALKKKKTPEFFLESSWDPIRFEDYERHYTTSEYAAWTAAFGVQLNHFTVFVNDLKTFHSLQELNDFLIQNGIILNSAGGLIKGNPGEYLEQSSTMARRVPWVFANGVKKDVMGCYYEFAKRYPLPDGKLFQGFIPKSANKIFESTYERPS